MDELKVNNRFSLCYATIIIYWLASEQSEIPSGKCEIDISDIYIIESVVALSI